PALAPLSVPNSKFLLGRGFELVGRGDPASFQTLSQSVDTVVEGPPPPDVRSPVLAFPSSSKRSKGTGSGGFWGLPGGGPKILWSIGALTTIVRVPPPGRVALLAVRRTSFASGVSEAESNPSFEVIVQFNAASFSSLSVTTMPL